MSIENKLEVQVAPPELFPITGGTSAAITELRGNANPRIPLKSGPSGSVWTSFTAAVRRNSFSIKNR